MLYVRAWNMAGAWLCSMTESSGSRCFLHGQAEADLLAQDSIKTCGIVPKKQPLRLTMGEAPSQEKAAQASAWEGRRMGCTHNLLSVIDRCCYWVH